MAKTRDIELPDGTSIPIVHEDRSVLVIDKPPGWMLAPNSWDRTGRNLQRALESSVAAGDFWARSRNLRYIRFIHRLDADTSGLLLLARNPGVLNPFQKLFESRQVKKLYLAVVRGIPEKAEWACRLEVMPDPSQKGRMVVQSSGKAKPAGERDVKSAETHFRLLESGGNRSLVEARPVTGRTHQIRVHLTSAGHPVLGDTLYEGLTNRGQKSPNKTATHPHPKQSAWPLALRAVALSYPDPFTGRPVHIQAPWAEFVEAFGFRADAVELR